MYSNTAYEALYQLMGLKLQETITGWITSQYVFRAALFLIFGFSFMMFLLHYFSNLAPGWIGGRSIGASRAVSLLLGLFIGVSILKVGVGTTVSSMSGVPWGDNPYIVSKDPSLAGSFQVSFLFRLLSGSAEELSRGLGFAIDKMFSQSNPQMIAPNLFYKAVLGAAADTIESPELKYDINLYTEECLSKVLPQFNPTEDVSSIDQYFSINSPVDQKLAQIPVGNSPTGPSETCLQMKEFINDSLTKYAQSNSSVYQTIADNPMATQHLISGFGQNFTNLVTSSMLMNHYLQASEGNLGMEKGTEIPGVSGRIAQFLSRNLADGFLTAIGRKDLRGVTLAAARSQELSDHLARAPHIAGQVKLFLIGFFPILVFFLAAGKYRPLFWWWLAYGSVCLWTPIWALLYHTMTALVLTTETMQAFGRLSDGLSLYAASLVSSRMYQAFAAYSYLQLAVGPLFSGGLLLGVRHLLADTDSAPSPGLPGAALGAASTATSVASTAGSVATGAAELL